MCFKSLLLSLCLVLLVTTAKSQNNESYTADTVIINGWMEKASAIIYINPDSAFIYCDSILTKSTAIKYYKGILKANNLNGIAYWMLKDYDKALEYYNDALKYADSTDDLRNRAIVLGNIGLLLSQTFSYDSAITYYNKAITYSKKNNISDIYSKTLIDISNLYIEQDNYIEGIKNLTLAKDILIGEHDSINLAIIYGTYGVLYTGVNNFDSSYFYYKKAIELDLVLDKFNNMANTFMNIGYNFFYLKEDADSAMYYYQKAITAALPYNKKYIELAGNINIGNIFLQERNLDSVSVFYNKVLNDTLIKNFPKELAAISVNMGIYYQYKENYSKARRFFGKGYAMSDSLNLLRFKAYALQGLASLDSTLGNYKESLNYYHSFRILSDSLKQTEAANEMEILEFEKYLAQQKYNNQSLIKENELKNKLITKQQIIIWLTLFAALFLLFFLYIMYRNRIKIRKLLSKIKSKNTDLLEVNEELNASNDVMQAQQIELETLNLQKDKFFSILGHDLKSPYNGLLGLLQIMDLNWEELDDQDKRDKIHTLYQSSLSNLQLLENLLTWGKAQQGLLEYSPELFSPKEKIIDLLELFVSQIENKKLKVEIDIPDKLEINTDPQYFIQIMQNLIVNAIKFSHNGSDILLRSNIFKDRGKFCVKDNGIGIPENKVDSIFNLDADFNRPGTANEKSTGMGLILCREYGNIIGADFTVTSSEENLADNIPGWSEFCFTIKV